MNDQISQYSDEGVLEGSRIAERRLVGAHVRSELVPVAQQPSRGVSASSSFNIDNCLQELDLVVNANTNPRTVGAAPLPAPQILSTPAQEEEEDRDICRICMEGTEVGGKQMTLVYPCKCQGSVRYVHEECLKTWIVAQHKDIFTAKCELCHTSLRQEIEIAHQCHCEDLCQQNKLVTFCSLLCLLILTVAVAVVLYFFTAKQSMIGGSASQEIFTVVSVVVLAVFVILLALMLRYALLEHLIIKKVKLWKIHNYELRERRQDEFFASERKKRVRILKIRSQPVLESGKSTAMAWKDYTNENDKAELANAHAETGKKAEKNVAVTSLSTPQLAEFRNRFHIMSREFLLQRDEQQRSVDVLMELHEENLEQLEQQGIVRIGRGRKIRVVPVDDRAQ